jgi:glycosyltransferase involved in cell wall biosynthesis
MSRPLVVLDADTLGRSRTGDETYVANLLRELPALAPDLRFAAVTRHAEAVPPGVEALHLPVRSQVTRMSFGLPRLLRRLRPALAHFLYVIPPLYRGLAVVTVHDISYEHLPEVMTVRDRAFFRTLVPRSARRAARVLTGSEWTKNDLVGRYGLHAERIAVTPYGVESAYSAVGEAARRGRYLLVVGALQPRKDPLTAVRALALLDHDMRLLFAGPEKRGGNEVRAEAARLGVADRVEFLGHVDMAELVRLYRGAACVVLPSLYEGFGLPVLEAMACGAPVVATTAGSIPEVAGEAAVLVPIRDPQELANGVGRALAERERLVAGGREHAAAFSWTRTARKTLAVYRELL